MALYFKTANPNKLLSEFRKAIDAEKILTWSYDSDGDFTHTVDQWKHKAWLRPKIQNGRLELFIIPPKNSNISSLVYAIYHGRFIESILVHCDKYFESGTATAFPEGSDNVSQG
ncbi:hypothetical protein A3F60_00215 [Candidatus Roizmanbacteria bacterium RIFCSPHIGHO2_12_FULL_39_8]|uniref:Uncharacterized protein n=1 Tax=Candidatus Roizmanbacteria bacterium RIFCSPHIGHO2_12_FULL_39_8 TaxID=1802050 RepID=A0A1F7I2F9_9BACT|nr:MAG: hypothetical protein A3F60_00215 [Candidatus Roizmanbacteria bacterium RIFCSPHIGHO2_12_FULL_39_8]